jgi:hypothetical protein
LEQQQHQPEQQQREQQHQRPEQQHQPEQQQVLQLRALHQVLLLLMMFVPLQLMRLLFRLG